VSTGTRLSLPAGKDNLVPVDTSRGERNIIGRLWTDAVLRAFKVRPALDAASVT